MADIAEEVGRGISRATEAELLQEDEQANSSRAWTASPAPVLPPGHSASEQGGGEREDTGASSSQGSEKRLDEEVKERLGMEVRKGEGCQFHGHDSDVWRRFPHPSGARFNPPQQTVPLPFHLYGQPFYRGFHWEKKV
eukprot:TRINITY_DN3024_c0_g1_i1.p1 TRINITY_DN3024_c0_g1~~TRINITY_DN3024_c0_g1_i1.p1  ORF type:complete len:138 (-),score=51.93 TRINITY_DN3024_c0_g1_i1:78-491(-)